MEIGEIISSVRERIKPELVKKKSLKDFYSYLENSGISEFNAQVYERPQKELYSKNHFVLGREYGVSFTVLNPKKKEKIIGSYSFPVGYLNEDQVEDRRGDVIQKCFVVLEHRLRTRPEESIPNYFLNGIRMSQQQFNERVEDAKAKGKTPLI